jgi:hypothetical protein
VREATAKYVKGVEIFLKREVEEREKKMGEMNGPMKDQATNAIIFNPIVRMLYERMHEEQRQREKFIADYSKVIDEINVEVQEIEKKRDAWVAYLEEEEADEEEGEVEEEYQGRDKDETVT